VTELTPRQKVIARFVHRGMTSRQIADALDISPRTVEVHRANIARRLAAARMVQKDPLDHPVVQRALKRLSRRVAMLASELAELRAMRSRRGHVVH
jgi:DNA-binding NarL/FixJ family response regulator